METLVPKLLLIALGGAAGSVGRYLLAGAVQRLAGATVSPVYGLPETFPFGTLCVNVLGCLLIGVLHAILTGPILMREEYRFGLTVGLLGGFTTFSTFGLETFHLLTDGQWRYATLNVLLSCLLGLAAVWLGYRVALRVFGV
jgi:CrcB protein